MKRTTVIADAGSIPAASTTCGGALVSTGSRVVRGGNEQATVSEGANHKGQEQNLDHAEERDPHGLRVRRLNSGIAGSPAPGNRSGHLFIAFGPFNGRPVSELPDWYLYQLVTRRLWPNLAAAVECELKARARMRRRAA